MARFRFTLRRLFAEGATQPLVSQRSLRALDLIDADELPRGPGWFDSSWDLNRGLEVREGLPADVRLNEWLTVCLGTGHDAGPTPTFAAVAVRGRRPATRPAQVRAEATAAADPFGIGGLELL
jgi:hypothetical protein